MFVNVFKGRSNIGGHNRTGHHVGGVGNRIDVATVNTVRVASGGRMNGGIGC